MKQGWLRNFLKENEMMDKMDRIRVRWMEDGENYLQELKAKLQIIDKSGNPS
jgi:hypothetical protein